MSGHRVVAALHADAVVVRGRNTVTRVPFHVGAEIERVVPRRHQLVYPVAMFCRRYWQIELDRLAARELLRRGYLDVAGVHPEYLPLRREVRRRAVSLEVVREDHSGVVADVFVTGVGRSDSALRLRS